VTAALRTAPDLDRGNGHGAPTSTLSVRNLWKVFGPAEPRVKGGAKDLLDLPNAEFRQKTGSTVAVRDV
jgi:hypothetical protein